LGNADISGVCFALSWGVECKVFGDLRAVMAWL
jgi:hypothetical protein